MTSRSRCLHQLLCGLLALGLAASASAGEHVRVVLDVSQSMRRNDSPRLALLSTLLLFDLAAPNVTLDDSFVVYPFHPAQHWVNPSDPPPLLTAAPIVAGRDRRDLVRRVHNIEYSAAWTYFYPGIRRAVEDLEATPGGRRDVRVIVLVTDGVPEGPTRDEELRRIRTELLPRLDAGGIRFYVLAFGPKASSERSFFESLTRTGAGGAAGELFIDPTGEGLLSHMAEIFSRSFGYTQERVGRVPVPGLDLDGGTTPNRVAVTVFSRASRVPSLTLSPPPGGAVQAPTGVVTASEVGASYALTWVLSPHAGDYRLRTDAPRAQVGVLRPSQVELELRPAPPLTRLDRVMAGKPFTLQLLARPATGSPRDPGALDVVYRIHGARKPGGSGGPRYEWDGKQQAPPAGSGKWTGSERAFDLRVEFPIGPRPDDDANAPYQGHIEVEARRGEAVVASLAGPRAHRVEVYPYLALHPTPTRADARHPGAGSGSPTLSRGDEGCAHFDLALETGVLPEGELALRVTVDPAIELKGPLAGASFSLDGLPVEIEGRPGPQQGRWYLGRRLDRERLLGKHVVCVEVGKPTSGNPGKALDVPLVLTLQESPYDVFDVIQPFVLAVRIEEPSLVDRWGSAIWLAALLLATFVALLVQRFRPRLPADLRVVLGREDSPDEPPPQALPSPSSAVAWLPGMRHDSPLEARIDGRRLGSLRPLEDELFAFSPARGVRVTTADGEPVASSHGLCHLQVRRGYRLRVGDTGYTLRLGYER